MSIGYPRGQDERGNLVRQNLKEDLAPSVPTTPSFPNLEQAAAAKYLLQLLPLPLELIEVIMDLAEYWPSVTSSMKDSVAVLSDFRAKMTDFHSIMFTYHHWVKEYLRNRELFRSEAVGLRRKSAATSSWKLRASNHAMHPLDQIGNSQQVALPTRGTRPCRKIVFDIFSRKDRIGYNVEEASTWFEATLRKPDCEHSVEPLSSLNDCTKLNIIQQPTKPHAKVFNSMQSLWKAPISIAKGFAPKRKVGQTSGGTESTPIVLTYNKTETKRNHHHCVAWRYNDVSGSDRKCLSDGAKFVRSIEVGDRIILYARAGSDTHQSTISMTYVASATVKIYWAV